MAYGRGERRRANYRKSHETCLSCEFRGYSLIFKCEIFHVDAASVTQGVTQSFVHVLFYLAALPEYIAPLRAEIEEVIEREGWSKEGLDKMHKVDSFIKESQRMNPIGNRQCCSILQIAHADNYHLNSLNGASC